MEIYRNEQQFTESLSQMFDQLPVFVYFKNTASKHLWYNKYTSEYVKKHLDIELYNKTNFELFDEQSAYECTNEEGVMMGFLDDQEALLRKDNYRKEGNTHYFDESITFSNKHKFRVCSYQNPVFDPDNQVQGIVGVSILQPHFNMEQTINAYQFEHTLLSQRECNVAELIVKGYSARAISEQLFISKRTVETYIENMKNKLICHNKQELIEYLLDHFLTNK